MRHQQGVDKVVGNQELSDSAKDQLNFISSKHIEFNKNMVGCCQEYINDYVEHFIQNVNVVSEVNDTGDEIISSITIPTLTSLPKMFFHDDILTKKNTKVAMNPLNYQKVLLKMYIRDFSQNDFIQDSVEKIKKEVAAA